LLVVSALSFLCHRPALRDGRLQLWLLFAILGGWNLRLTPFFAVVAGIVLVLNVQDGMRCSAASPVAARSGRRLAGYAATVAACVVALGFAWTGWLYSAFGQPRCVAWNVQTDPALQQAAERRATWRSMGLLDDSDRAFHAHPDSAHYSAWFCPGERVFLDLRLNLF